MNQDLKNISELTRAKTTQRT